jgi:heme A synthase
VAGGIIAPISALLGWFNAGFSLSDTDPLMMAHRWLGTGIGVGGFALGIWAWRRPWEDRQVGMIAALTAMTIAIAVQGWFGGALVHGIDHLNW